MYTEVQLYRGIKKELSPKLQEKLDAKFAKISKLAGEARRKGGPRGGDHRESALHKAEITMQFYEHPLVGIASDADLFTALSAALDKLDKQAVKNCAKWRAKARRSSRARNRNGAGELVGVVATSDDAKKSAQKVYRVNHLDQRKPMTLEEALLEMARTTDYVVYRDADKECVSVLVRRRDGHFDLIES